MYKITSIKETCLAASDPIDVCDVADSLKCEKGDANW